jgi:CrcB protein
VRLLNLLVVMAGAGLGGGLRYALGGWVAQRWGAAFPWNTLAVNLSGSFLLGLLVALSLERDLVSPPLRLFLGVGLLGGYTTFSTLAWESLALIQQGCLLQGAANLLGSPLLGLAAAVAGLVLGRMI